MTCQLYPIETGRVNAPERFVHPHVQGASAHAVASSGRPPPVPSQDALLKPAPARDATDEQLMERYARDGDSDALTELFARYGGRLLGYFRRFVGGDPVAQDLVQQTFLQLHRARRDYRPGAPLRPWLYTIAANLRREHFRYRGRRPEVAHDPERHGVLTTEPEASTPEGRLLHRALDQLPEHEREVVVLHWFEDLPMGEVAQVLGASRGAVKVRAHRAYKRLRTMLEEGLPAAEVKR